MKLSIRLKFIVYTLCIVLLVGGSISLYFIFEGQRRILNNFDDESRRITSALASTIASDLYFLDTTSLRYRLANARMTSALSYTYVTDLNGVVLADGTQTNAHRDQRLTDPFSAKVLQADGWVSSIDGGSLKVGGPVSMPDGIRIGYLQAGFSLDETHQLIRQTTQANLYLTLFCLGVGGILAFIVATSLSRPLLPIMRAAKEIGKGRFDTRISLERGDELGTLAESVNLMAEALQARDVEIKRTNEVLRADRERFRGLVETTHAIPWEADANTWLFNYIGPQAVTLLGHPLDQWYEKEFWVNHIHPDDRDYATDLSRTSSRTQDVYELEYRMLASSGQAIWVHDVISVVREHGEPKTLHGFMIDITQRKQVEETLKALVEGTASQIGEGFFRSLVSSLAAVLEVRHAFVSEFVDGDTKARTFAFWSGGHFVDNIEYPLADTPCEQVLDGEIRHYPENVQAIFPKDKDLVTLEAEGYLAVPVVGESDDILGHLAVIHDKPLHIGTRQLALIQIFAARAGAELVRRQAEEALRDSEAALRASQAELRKLAGDLLAGQEAERRSLARELHDDLTQRLAALNMDIAAVEGQQDSSIASVHDQLYDLRTKIAGLASDVHGMARHLHPSVIDDLGLIKALGSECRSFSQREGIAVEFEHRHVPRTLPKNVALSLYRIAQEGLRNVAKHSTSPDATIELVAINSEISLAVKDRGVGFSVAEVKGRGLGLISMRERARLNGGAVAVHSTPGKGTTIEIRMPLRGEAN